MGHITLALTRLDAIAASLAATPHGLALLALGSSGAERARMDQYSDLDFFAIVATGHKAAYLSDLDWLTRVAPVAYVARNTADGYRLLYADGVFCEMAVFEPPELAGIGGAASWVVWQAPGFSLADYQRPDEPVPAPRALEAMVDDVLSNLYVGLGRYRRGEKLTATRWVQGYALNALIEVCDATHPAAGARRDPFNNTRRVEQRHPALAAQLPALAGGYAETPAAARAILAYLETLTAVNAAMKQAILALAADD